MYTTLKSQLLSVLKHSGFELPSAAVKLERPTESSHGDWSTNVAMIIAGQQKDNPRVVAAKIATELEADSKIMSLVEKVEVAGPGFINFRIRPEYYQELVTTPVVLEKTTTPQKIMVEFGQPNTHKLPHIGHLFSYISGDSIANILEVYGHTVRKVNYQGDVGPHVAKCLYGWYQLGKQEPEGALAQAKHLQECYQLGATAYEENPEAKTEIDAINKSIYQVDSEINSDWKKTRQWSLDFYREFEEDLGIDQKEHYLESRVWEKGMSIVRENLGKAFVESNDAIVFPGENYGLHTRVFITKHGTPTYECKDLGLSVTKMGDWPFDKAVITTASEQNAYFQVVIAAINVAVPALKDKIKHIGFGMISLNTGKMSSRTGKIISAPDLLQMVKERVGEIVGKRENLSETEKAEITHKVALGAVKYAFLRGNILQNMTFNLDESIAFEGNSGPYLQYTYARIKSIVNKAGKTNSKFSPHILNTLEELDLLRWLERMPEVVKSAAENYSPHLMATYLFELAQKFNSFYKRHSINNAETEALKAARLALANKVADQLQTGLNLLGIETVEKM